MREGHAEALPERLERSWARALVALPGGWQGRMEELPPQPEGLRRAAVVFMHGSSGLGLAAVPEFLRWLADTQDVAAIAPDSFAAAGRLAYVSPAPVGRLVAQPEPAVRIITSWGCEAGYFVDAPSIAIPREGSRTLSVVASRDPFFSPLNP